MEKRNNSNSTPASLTNQLQGLNADPNQFSQQDFMTQEDMMENNPIHDQNVQFQPKSDDDTDKMLQENHIPNSSEKKDIYNKVDNGINKIDKEALINERIENDLNSIRGKNNSVPKDPKDILKNLVAKGEYQETFKLYGHNWTFRALDQNDLLLALDEISDSLETQSGRLSASMFAQTVYALEEIDGIPVYKWFPDIKLEDYRNQQQFILAVKRALRGYMAGLAPSVIDELYMKYLEVEERRNEGLEELKNS